MANINSSRRRIHESLIPMILALLLLAGFQVYWLTDNYNREKEALKIRTNGLFRETVRQMQDSVMSRTMRMAVEDSVSAQLDDTLTGTLGQSFLDQLLIRSRETRGRDRHRDDRSDRSGSDRNNRSGNGRNDRTMDDREPGMSSSGTLTIDGGKGKQMTIQLDSLVLRRIPAAAIEKEYQAALSREKIGISFRIVDLQDNAPGQDSLSLFDFDDQRRPGQFQHYRLVPATTTSWLLRRIALPILFSVFLVAICVFAFVLMYRSLVKQYRLSVIRSDLISNITHELKTPIATVGVAIEALRNFNAIQDTAKTAEYLDISQLELQRLGLLVDKVLKLSMFENREIRINKELIDLGEVVEEVSASMRLQLEKHRTTVTLEKSGDLLMQGDRLHLLSVVFNLVDNALKYGRDNTSIVLNISGDQDAVILRIADEGIGIPAIYRDKVFDKFFRVPYGDTHNAKGHGLGLSYVAQVVQQHGGTIRVDSEEGKGSTFTIRFPKSTNASSYG